MNVTSQPAPVQRATTATTASTTAAKPADVQARPAGSAALDQFVPGKRLPPIMPPIWKPLDTLNPQDRQTASNLPETLSNPLDKPLLDAGKKDVSLSRDDSGVMRGPDGQPLAKVQLKDGTTAYVDPNTNQYYLTDEREQFGQVNALGPLPLPKGAQFSNNYFSDADTRSIERDARGGGIIGFPFPRPPIDPLPLPPRPFPLPFPDPGFPRLPVDPWGPVKPFDPSVLLGASAGKAPGIE